MVHCTQDFDAIKRETNNETKKLLTEEAWKCCSDELHLLEKQLSERGTAICKHDIKFNMGVTSCNELKLLDIEYKNTLVEFNRTEHECKKLNTLKDTDVNHDHVIIDLDNTSNSASSLEVSGILSAAAVMVGYYLLS